MRPSDYKTKQKEIILNFFIENKNKKITFNCVKYCKIYKLKRRNSRNDNCLQISG